MGGLLVATCLCVTGFEATSHADEGASAFDGPAFLERLKSCYRVGLIVEGRKVSEEMVGLIAEELLDGGERLRQVPPIELVDLGRNHSSGMRRAKDEGLALVLRIRRLAGKRAKPQTNRYVKNAPLIPTFGKPQSGPVESESMKWYGAVATAMAELYDLHEGDDPLETWECERDSSDGPRYVTMVNGKIPDKKGVSTDAVVASLIESALRSAVVRDAQRLLWKHRADLESLRSSLDAAQLAELWDYVHRVSRHGIRLPRASIRKLLGARWRDLLTASAPNPGLEDELKAMSSLASTCDAFHFRDSAYIPKKRDDAYLLPQIEEVVRLRAEDDQIVFDRILAGPEAKLPAGEFSVHRNSPVNGVTVLYVTGKKEPSFSLEADPDLYLVAKRIMNSRSPGKAGYGDAFQHPGLYLLKREYRGQKPVWKAVDKASASKLDDERFVEILRRALDLCFDVTS